MIYKNVGLSTAVSKLLSKGIEFNNHPWLTGQRQVLWCTPWACEEAGRRTHSSAQASRGDDLRREGSSVSCAEPQTKWPPFAPPVSQCGHVILDHWRTPPKKMAEKKTDTRNKMVHDSIFPYLRPHHGSGVRNGSNNIPCYFHRIMT